MMYTSVLEPSFVYQTEVSDEMGLKYFNVNNKSLYLKQYTLN